MYQYSIFKYYAKLVNQTNIYISLIFSITFAASASFILSTLKEVLIKFYRINHTEISVSLVEPETSLVIFVRL